VAVLKTILRFVVPMVFGLPLVLIAQFATMAMDAPDYAGIVLFLGMIAVVFFAVKVAMTGKMMPAERYTAVAVGSAAMLCIGILGLVTLTGLLILGASWKVPDQARASAISPARGKPTPWRIAWRISSSRGQIRAGSCCSPFLDAQRFNNTDIPKWILPDDCLVAKTPRAQLNCAEVISLVAMSTRVRVQMNPA
jgi:hypothetical protein